MSSDPPKPQDETAADEAPKKSGKKKLIMMAIPVVLLLVGAGLWFTGILPHMLGMEKKGSWRTRNRPSRYPPAMSTCPK